MVNELLRLTSDRKTRLYPSQKNTYGLSPGSLEVGGSCPGATYEKGGCAHVKEGRKLGDCYVMLLQVSYKGVKPILQHNTELIKKSSKEELVEILTNEFLRFEATERSRGNTTILNYRLHWSGDILNEEYAEALAIAIKNVPNVKFWGYTRSFFAIPILSGIANLKMYISADEANEKEALEVYNAYVGSGNISICWMGKVRPMNSNFPRLVSCPVDSGKMELEGGCHNCKLCFRGTPVFFEVKK